MWRATLKLRESVAGRGLLTPVLFEEQIAKVVRVKNKCVSFILYSIGLHYDNVATIFAK